MATSGIGQKAQNTQPASASHEEAMQTLIRQAEQEGKDEIRRQAERQFATNDAIGSPRKLYAQMLAPLAPRKIFVGANSNDPVLAAYLERWYKVLEKVGNAHYRQLAQQQKIYGSVQSTIEIDTKGKLLNIEINRSSGHAVLDDAVSNITKRAAPFEPLPLEIRQRADIVSITRTWTFTTEEALKAKTKEVTEHRTVGQGMNLITLPATTSKFPLPSAEQ